MEALTEQWQVTTNSPGNTTEIILSEVQWHYCALAKEIQVPIGLCRCYIDSLHLKESVL